MTVTELRDVRDIPRDIPEGLSADELRALARQEWHESGGTRTGKELAAMFGKSPRWGQDQAAAARRETETRGKPPVAAPAPERKPAVPRRKPKAAVAVQRVTAAAVALVAVVAAAASYSHMHDLALEAGEGTMARVLPLSVDGLVVAATMALLAARRAGRQAGALPWLALLLGLGASLAANVAAAEPTIVGRLVAAWPPVALALSFELLLRQTHPEER